MIKAIENNNLERVKSSYHANKNEINAIDCTGWTPLTYAIVKGRYDIIEYLVEQGADLNLRDALKWTPLMLAIRKRKLDIVKYLVEKGANLNFCIRSNWPPFLWAARGDNLKILDYLIEKGVDVNAVGYSGWTLLLWALTQDDLEFVKYLISKGAHINYTDSEASDRFQDSCKTENEMILHVFQHCAFSGTYPSWMKNRIILLALCIPKCSHQKKKKIWLPIDVLRRLSSFLL